MQARAEKAEARVAELSTENSVLKDRAVRQQERLTAEATYIKELAEKLQASHDAESKAQRCAKELQAIVARLPKTADGVAITTHMNFYLCNLGEVVGAGALSIRHDEGCDFGHFIEFRDGDGYEGIVNPDQIYSTREAALAAKEKQS